MLFGNLVQCVFLLASPNSLARMASLNNGPFTRSIFNVRGDANLFAVATKVIFLEPVRSHCLSSYFRILITAAREVKGFVLRPKMEAVVLSREVCLLAMFFSATGCIGLAMKFAIKLFFR